MRAKTKGYLVLGICGIIVSVAVAMFRENLSDLGMGVLSGIGSMAVALGAARFLSCRYEERHPEWMRQNEIEAKDERNTLIRHKAQAVAGVYLQWLVIGIAWLSILLDGPLWITLCAVGVFFGKVVLETVLMGYYQCRM